VLPGITLDPAAVQTNIVIFEVGDARELVRRLADRVELTVVGANRVRAVTHLDVGATEIEQALAAISDSLG
jgi:threonine aldolase